MLYYRRVRVVLQIRLLYPSPQQPMAGITYVWSVLRTLCCFPWQRIEIMRTGTSAPKGYYKSGKNLRYKRVLPLDPATARLNHALDSLKQAVAKPFNIKSRIDVFDDALQTLLVLRGSF